MEISGLLLKIPDQFPQPKFAVCIKAEPGKVFVIVEEDDDNQGILEVN